MNNSIWDTSPPKVVLDRTAVSDYLYFENTMTAGKSCTNQEAVTELETIDSKRTRTFIPLLTKEGLILDLDVVWINPL